MAAPTNSYVITNRAPDGKGSFDTTTLNNNGSTLSYVYWATGTNPTAPSGVDYETVWKPALLADLVASATGAANEVPGVGQLLIFIHGYGNSWADALANLYTPSGKLANLAAFGPFPGPIVEIDWPSSGIMATAMTNASQTGQNSVPQLNTIIADARSMIGNGLSAVNVVIVCHSMGNYVLQQVPASAFSAGTIQQCLLVAAMISIDSFNAGEGSPTPAQNILDMTAGNVTVYYSRNDDVLPLAGVTSYKWAMLGMGGPMYSAPAASALPGQVVGVDCSAVVNSANEKAYGSPQVHQAYFYIPQVMQDITATILSNDRVQFQNTTAGFQMQALPFTPVAAPSTEGRT